MDSVIKPFKSSDINILPEEEARGWSNYKPPEEKWVMTMNVTKKKKKNELLSRLRELEYGLCPFPFFLLAYSVHV